MEQGIILLLKLKYRILSVRCIITALENNKEIPSFSVFDAINMLVLARESATLERITNFFSKAGISKDQQRAAINDNDDPFKTIAEEIKRLRDQKSGFTSNNLLSIEIHLSGKQKYWITILTYFCIISSLKVFWLWKNIYKSGEIQIWYIPFKCFAVNFTEHRCWRKEY